jgi:hypothetical protein
MTVSILNRGGYGVRTTAFDSNYEMGLMAENSQTAEQLLNEVQKLNHRSAETETKA